MAEYRVTELLKKIASGEKTGRDLDTDEACWLMGEALSGRLEGLQAGAMLAVLRLKGETPSELTGFLQALYKSFQPIRRRSERRPLVAHCGATNGKSVYVHSGPGAALLAAAAGVEVLLCGRTGSEARAGTTELEVFRHLGIRPEAGPGAAAERLEESGLALLEQAAVHPGLTQLSLARDLLGMRTVAQSMERFLFPVRPTAALAGGFHIDYLRRLAEAAAAHFDHPVFLLQQRDGAVDLAPVGPAKSIIVRDGVKAETEWLPEAAGLVRQGREQLTARGPAETADLTRQVLACAERGALRQMILYNAGLLLHAGRPDQPLHECVADAVAVLDSGEGLRHLKRLI